jgi:hypothetical protein
MRMAYEAHQDDNDFIQPGTLYRQVMTPTDRDHLVDNIVGHLSQGVERVIEERAVNDYWTQVDPDLGARVAHGLGLQDCAAKQAVAKTIRWRPRKCLRVLAQRRQGPRRPRAYDEHTVMPRARLDRLAWSWAGSATRHNFCPRAPAGLFSQLKGETWNQGRVR